MTEPGQLVWAVQYTQLHARPGQDAFGPILIVGTELRCLEAVSDTVRVVAPDDSVGWVATSRLTSHDPRVFFAMEGSSRRGYLVSGMYPDYSGGSVDQLVLASSEGLGEVHLQTALLVSIVFGPEGTVVTTGAGDTFEGTPGRWWLVGHGFRFQLDGKARMRLVRA